MRIRDPNLQSTCDALDWMVFSDRLNHVIMHGQNFSLMRYLPFLSVTFHFLFAHTHVPRISYPHSQQEVLIAYKSCLTSLDNKINPDIHIHWIVVSSPGLLSSPQQQKRFDLDVDRHPGVHQDQDQSAQVDPWYSDAAPRHHLPQITAGMLKLLMPNIYLHYYMSVRCWGGSKTWVSERRQ